MGKRIIGVVFTLLGALGLIMAGVEFVQNSNGVHNIKLIVVYAILGVVFFIAGMGLMRTTRDVVSNNEHVS